MAGKGWFMNEAPPQSSKFLYFYISMDPGSPELSCPGTFAQFRNTPNQAVWLAANLNLFCANLSQKRFFLGPSIAFYFLITMTT